jgi:hypothetical protein
VFCNLGNSRPDEEGVSLKRWIQLGWTTGGQFAAPENYVEWRDITHSGNDRFSRALGSAAVLPRDFVFKAIDGPDPDTELDQFQAYIGTLPVEHPECSLANFAGVNFCQVQYTAEVTDINGFVPGSSGEPFEFTNCGYRRGPGGWTHDLTGKTKKKTTNGVIGDPVGDTFTIYDVRN